MKIRTDFVTNSSSSSFIIQTDKEIPKEFTHLFTKLTKDNIIDVFYELYEDCYGSGPLTKLQRLGNFTDDQIKLIHLYGCEVIDKLNDIIEYLDSIDNIYISVEIDNNYIYRHEFSNFISSVKVLDKEDF